MEYFRPSRWLVIEGTFFMTIYLNAEKMNFKTKGGVCVEDNNSLFLTANEVEPSEIEWLWYPYISFGKVALLQGDPGDGKSTFMLSIAALLSQGKQMPFAETEALEPMTIIYQTTEDDLSDTVVPRYIRAGGDPTRLVFIKEDRKALTFDDERIPKVIKETGARLLILDPLSSYIGNNCALNSANDVRTQFNYLIRIAKETGCAIVIIAHMNKMLGTKAIYRTTGSIDVVGAVRSSLIIGRESPDSDERILVQQKSNLAATGCSIRFTVNEDGVTFLEECQLTADELLGNFFSGQGRPDEKLQACCDFITEMLKDGPRPSTECISRLKAAGHHERTARAAKKQLGIVSKRENDIWFWALPS